MNPSWLYYLWSHEPLIDLPPVVITQDGPVVKVSPDVRYSAGPLEFGTEMVKRRSFLKPLLRSQ